MICVLLLAAGEPWESAVLQHVEQSADLMVLRRCMDVADLLGAAGTGQAQVAVVALAAPGFDARAVSHLQDAGVHAVGVAADPASDEVLERAVRIGVSTLVAPHDVAELSRMVRDLPDAHPSGPSSPAPAAGAGPVTGARIRAVWGPAGAPGRSTVAAAVACALSRGRHVTLVDADPWAPSLAQQLGLLDDTSGLLAAVRSVGSGRLPDQWPQCVRRITPTWDVVTGLPRPERWNEVRSDAVAAVLTAARGHGDVVVDTGPVLEENPDGRPGRNVLTLESLRVADDVLVVGAPDPVGLTRLVHGVARLWEMGLGSRVHVVVNRMRPGVGFSRPQIVEMLGHHVGGAPVHFLPEDRGTADRALLAGRSVVEVSTAPLAAALTTLVDHLPGATHDAAHPRKGAPRRFGRSRS